MVSTTAVGDSTRAPARAEHGRRLRLDRIGGRLILYLVLVFFFLVFFVPFIWIWSSALKTSIEIARDPFALPTTFHWENLKKAWTTGQTDDISLKTLLLFGCGLGLWVVYGLLQKDIIIILANGVSLALLAGLVYLKLVQTPS